MFLVYKCQKSVTVPGQGQSSWAQGSKGGCTAPTSSETPSPGRAAWCLQQRGLWWGDVGARGPALCTAGQRAGEAEHAETGSSRFRAEGRAAPTAPASQRFWSGTGLSLGAAWGAQALAVADSAAAGPRPGPPSLHGCRAPEPRAGVGGGPCAGAAAPPTRLPEGRALRAPGSRWSR